MKTAPLLFSSALLALAAAAQAQVSDVTFFRTNIHNQTSATTTSYAGSFFFAGISVASASDYGAATLTLPDGTTSYPLAQTGPEYGYGSMLYNSVAAEEADFPHGDYVYSLDGGTFPGGALALTDAEDRFAPEVPLAQEYDALKTATAGQGLTVHVDGFTPGPGTNDNLNFYILHDNTADIDDIVGVTSNAAYSFNIGGGDLVANHGYTLSLYYSSRLDIPNAGFGGATAFIGYDQLTTVDFTASAVPEPASLAALGLGVATMLRRRRK